MTIMLDSRPCLEEHHVPLLNQGKVRDNYDLGDRLLMVATDRISTYDVVHPNGIPHKGQVLAQLSAFWFQLPAIRAVCRNHFESLAGSWFPYQGRVVSCSGIAGRSLLVKKATQRFPVECIVRGYLAGSGWAEYTKSGTVNGVALPDGLVESQQLPAPIFTPTTKAEEGHDQALSSGDFVVAVGDLKLAEQLRDYSLALYSAGAEYALNWGIIIADTKFEFGLIDGEIALIDEILTPDSSRFWAAATYVAGKAQLALDKQFVRDWAAGTGWDKTPPAPALPEEIVTETSRRYCDIFQRLTGRQLAQVA